MISVCACMCVHTRVCMLAYIFRKKQWKVSPKTNERLHLYDEGEGREEEQQWERLFSEHFMLL